LLLFSCFTVSPYLSHSFISVCPDYYRSKLEKYIEDGILTHLFVSFSRDKRKENMPRYVQVNSMLFLFLPHSDIIQWSCTFSISLQCSGNVHKCIFILRLYPFYVKHICKILNYQIFRIKYQSRCQQLFKYKFSFRSLFVKRIA